MTTRRTCLYFPLILIILLIVSSPKESLAQAQEPCGTTPYTHLLQATQPGYSDSLLLNEEKIEQWLQLNKGMKTEDNLITIPVVVHIIYDPEHPEQNLSDWQVQSQMDVLNEDFRRLNADTSNTPDIFKPIAADFGIEFCLAKRDPANRPTTGIVRVETYVDMFSSFDKVKSSSDGGDNAWPSERYLNIWVCNMKGPQIGYATLPGGKPSLDGVVVHFAVFGRYDTKITGYNLGRTCTHEVGHWLNLHHTWGDKDSGCTDTDFVEDTPNQDSAVYGCPVFPVRKSCSNNGDMFMNYMNYAFDNCANLFTNGQKARAMAAMNTSRATILSSDAGNRAINYATDIGVSKIYFLQSNATNDSIRPVISISNYGTETVTSAGIHFQFHKQYPQYFIDWSGNLPPGESVMVTLPKIRVLSSFSVFLAYTVSPNGKQDMDTSNDFRSSRSILLQEVTTTKTANPYLLYPNPTNGSVTLLFDSPDWSQMSFELFNSLGQSQRVGTSIQPDSKVILEMAFLAPGIYFLRMNYKGQEYLEKLIKLPGN